MAHNLVRSTLLIAGTLLPLIACTPTIAQAAPQPEPQLSPSQTAIINQKIATLGTAGERNMAQSWSNAKKVGEMICRPAALSTLKKKNSAIDWVFLGTSDPATLTLESDQRLTGTGQYRIGYNWTNFTFTCDLDPKTGKVTGFQIVPLPAKQ
jgi:hypothetical protein